MAINFPSSPGDGEEYTDVNSGTWVYDSGTNSWTLTAAGSASAFNFRGGHDFTQATPPAAPIESGDLWVHDGPADTVNGVYNGLTGTIPEGQLVLWDGSKYVAVASAPGYPDLGDGGGSTLDDRYVNATGDNMTGDLTLGTDKITLDATDGSADFASDLIKLTNDGANGGRVEIAGASNRLLLSSSTAEDTATRLSESLSFAYAKNGVSQVVAKQSDLVLCASNNTNTQEILRLKGADGSATFAGVVDSASYNTAGGNPSYQLVPTGLFQVTGTTGEAAIRVFPQGAGDQNPSATINTDGDALFAGDVVSTSSSNSRSFIDGEGIYQSDVLGNNAITLLNDGNGEFTGTITTQGGAGGPYVAIGQTITFNTGADDDANYTITTETYEEQEELTPYIPAVPATYDEDGNELTAEVPAVEATYQTVTKTREVRTYTGPTLDVKERLQNLIARVDAIEADEVSDDATSSALLTLVASLSARIDALEAAG